MPVIVTLSEYRKNLKKQEKVKPVHKRRHVPTIQEMADEANLSRTGFLDFMYNRTHSINRRALSVSISLLRACGFGTTITDVLKYDPDTLREK